MLWAQLRRARLKPATPWFALVDQGPYAESDLEVELAVGVQLRGSQRQGDWGTGPVQLLELPAAENMASLIHDSPSATLSSAYTQLYAWTQAHGFQPAGPYREIYLPDTGVVDAPHDELDAGYIELQSPVQPASIPLSIQSSHLQKEQIMQPKIITKPAFKAVGLSYIGKNEAGEIPKMWDQFNARYDEVKAIEPSRCYGLCFSDIPDAAEGQFEYLAACEVADDQDIPQGMVYREVPEHKYAVFTHHGKLDKLGETYEYIYNTWLPQSGYQVHPSKYDMEVYDERYIHQSDDSEFDIYVALE
jgi:AraC family transcriptional regulator